MVWVREHNTSFSEVSETGQCEDDTQTVRDTAREDEEEEEDNHDNNNNQESISIDSSDSDGESNNNANAVDSQSST